MLLNNILIKPGLIICSYERPPYQDSSMFATEPCSSKAELPLWMGPLPARECIGGESAVYKGKMGLIVGVTQVLVVAPQLPSVQLALK